MVKHLLIFSTILMVAGPIARASDRQNDNDRMQKAGQVFKEIMDTPDKGIPHDLLDSAKCIAVIPGDKKFAFIFGGSYGRGVVTCRTARGWSAPMFLAIEGGSIGYQIGGSSTVAAGPVGRSAAAGTDLKLNAEILSYSRSKGIFAGVSLDGAVVQADKSGDQAQYGANVTIQEILDGQIQVPSSARRFIHELRAYSGATMGM
jgi:lipid-binding SYLF domain-containing protein